MSAAGGNAVNDAGGPSAAQPSPYDVPLRPTSACETMNRRSAIRRYTRSLCHEADSSLGSSDEEPIQEQLRHRRKHISAVQARRARDTMRREQRQRARSQEQLVVTVKRINGTVGPKGQDHHATYNVRPRPADSDEDQTAQDAPPERRVRWWSDMLMHHKHDVARGVQESYEEAPFVIAVLVVISYGILVCFGYFRDFLRMLRVEKNEISMERKEQLDFVNLYSEFEAMYTRNMYMRLRDNYHVPICSTPGATLTMLERVSDDYNWTFRLTGRKFELLNMGSYNYLGFAQNTGPTADDSSNVIKRDGLSACSSRHEVGSQLIHRELELLTAEFLGVEDAITFGMGFATNYCNLPCLITKGSLVMSDEFNHNSIIMGCRLSGAKIQTFRNNDMKDLERKLRRAIIYGHPKTRRPYRKIFIICEGVYSMEGSILNLRDIVALKKKYKAYLYVDEAHSIGAIGRHGGGVCEYWGVDPADVDILMGTFTKSFGSAGGYIAGRKYLIDYMKMSSYAACYATSMSPPAAQQIITSMRIIMGLDGTNDGQRRIRQLAINSRYLRRRLKQLGFIVYGNDDSPVIPLLLYFPSKISSFTRDSLSHRIGLVTTAFPATPITLGRGRLCLSSAHTREHLDRCCDVISQLGDEQWLKLSRVKRDQSVEIQYC